IERNHVFSPNGIGPFLFAFTVSLDSFSVGLSLGIREVETLILIILFGVTSMFLTWLGLAIARKVSGYLGKYGEMCGGRDRKSTRLNSSHVSISYAVFCLKKKI